MKFNLTHTQLKNSEKSVYSQGGQDGILEAIFKQLKIKKGFFVEWGGRDGIEISNTAYLRDNGWTGVLMDSEPLSDIVRQEFITAENINEILEKYNASDIDYCSIDQDGNDFWVWKAMKEKPKVVSIEFNSKFSIAESVAIEYNPNHKWAGDDYYSASLLALKKLGEQKGYTLVYAVDRYDAIFVRNDLLAVNYIPASIDVIFPKPIIAHDTISDKKWVNV